MSRGKIPTLTRGTTPTLMFFTSSVRADQIVGGYVTFTQRGVEFLEKKLEDGAVEVNDNTIKVHLTQEDTLKMTPVDKLKIQIRLKLKSNKAAASYVMEARVIDALKSGVI